MTFYRLLGHWSPWRLYVTENKKVIMSLEHDSELQPPYKNKLLYSFLHIKIGKNAHAIEATHRVPELCWSAPVKISHLHNNCYWGLLLLFSHQVISDCLQPHGLMHTRLPCPSLSPGVCSKSCPLSQWCHPTISSSDALLLLLSIFLSIRVFPMCWLFASGGQCIGVSAPATVLPINI